MNPQESPVIIVGGGIGGLTAALALQQSGVPVQVLEQSTSLTEVGAGLTIGPNASRVLIHLGLGETLERWGCVPVTGAILHFATGEPLVVNSRGDRPTEKFGAPYCMMHRADLYDALANAVRANDPGCIQLGARFRRILANDSGVSAELDDGRHVQGCLMVGCDGIRSAVREALFGAETPRFTGYVAWRGLVPVDRVNDPGIFEPQSAVFIGPDHQVVRYRVRAGELVNYVAATRKSGWEVESWSVHSEVSEVLSEFGEFCPSVRELIAATPPEHCYKWALFDRDPLPQWTVNRVTLLGDAAHPMLPFMGQGAVMAIEDAMVLARCLNLDGREPAALMRYENARRERTEFVMLESRANGERLQHHDPDSYGQGRHRNEETLGLFAYDAVNIPL